jgi:hypothetical protein
MTDYHIEMHKISNFASTTTTLAQLNLYALELKSKNLFVCIQLSILVVISKIWNYTK